MTRFTADVCAKTVCSRSNLSWFRSRVCCCLIRLALPSMCRTCGDAPAMIVNPGLHVAQSGGDVCCSPRAIAPWGGGWRRVASR